ncbi:hypothetical protein EON67_03590 [archaeon]|nr:MAG: hypothetical protein EON67_03590 [archaeon]
MAVSVHSHGARGGAPATCAYLLLVRSTWHGARLASAGPVSRTVARSLTLWTWRPALSARLKMCPGGGTPSSHRHLFCAANGWGPPRARTTKASDDAGCARRAWAHTSATRLWLAGDRDASLCSARLPHASRTPRHSPSQSPALC